MAKIKKASFPEHSMFFWENLKSGGLGTIQPEILLPEKLNFSSYIRTTENLHHEERRNQDDIGSVETSVKIDRFEKTITWYLIPPTPLKKQLFQSRNSICDF